MIDTFGSQTKAQEIILLLNDVKEVVRQGFYDSELIEVEKFCQENRLFLVKSKFKVLLDDGEDNKITNDYSNKGIRLKEDDPQGMYFVYISKSEEKAWLANYYELVGDDRSLGLLLGYPKCCVGYFCDNFKAEKTNLELKPTNPWTNLGKRAEDCVLLSHFPCSSDCEKSIVLGKKYFEILQSDDENRAEKLITQLSYF
tara:strand:- start:731 stop:1327 length:597 start_codon:yes stop_codon:yes gene_type:complete